MPGDALLATHGDHVLTVLEAVGEAEHVATAPEGATLVEVGGVRFWVFGTP